MSFREKLKSELSYQGILVKELADKVGISKRTLDNYLREKSSIPPVDIAVKIANALNVSVEYLVNDETTNSSQSNPYPSNIRNLADKLLELSDSDFKMAESLINHFYEKQKR